METKEIKPKVSVIVAVYMKENYLHQCMNFLLNQTFTDFEVLLVDDGSPDRSGKICDEYARIDSRVRVFYKENGGIGSAANAAWTMHVENIPFIPTLKTGSSRTCWS